MKIQFEENNSKEITPTKKLTPKKVNYNGQEYTYVGKSKEDPSVTTRVKALFECFGMTLASCLVIPCFFKEFRKTFKNARNELLSGQEIVKHYVINPTVFAQNKEKTPKPTDEESFQRGLEESNKFKFD